MNVKEATNEDLLYRLSYDCITKGRDVTDGIIPEILSRMKPKAPPNPTEVMDRTSGGIIGA